MNVLIVDPSRTVEALMPSGIKATISIGVATLGHGEGYDERLTRVRMLGSGAFEPLAILRGA
jgi:hypothetical protein